MCIYIYIYIFFFFIISLVVVHGLPVTGAALCCQAWAPGHKGSVVVVHGLSCSMACGILVPRPGINPWPLHWQTDSGPPGKSLGCFLLFFFWVLLRLTISLFTPLDGHIDFCLFLCLFFDFFYSLKKNTRANYILGTALHTWVTMVNKNCKSPFLPGTDGQVKKTDSSQSHIPVLNVMW